MHLNECHLNFKKDLHTSWKNLGSVLLKSTFRADSSYSNNIVKHHLHLEKFSAMLKWLKDRKSAVSIIVLMFFILLCLPQSAIATTDEAEILIFSLSADKVKEQKGVLKIQISTFSPIQQVMVKGKPRKFPKGASLVWLKIPYTLNPGVNIFEVYVKSKLGEAKKIIRTIYETPEFLNKTKLGDSFQLISILGSATSDNIEKADDGDSKSNAFSSYILLVPSYRFDIFNDSSIFLRGVLMGDQHHNGKFESKKVLFKQASIEWEERESWVGVLTISFATNEAGTREIPVTSAPRDSLSKDYKRATRDNIYTIKAKQKLERATTWTWQIDRKKKHAEGTNEDSGYSTSLSTGYVTPLFGMKTTFGGTLEDTNLNGTYKDTSALKTKLKVDYPISSVALGLQYDFSQTEDKVADPDLVGKTKTRNRALSLSLNYPAASWCIFGLTQKNERQSSNIAGKTYKLNTTQLQVILIY